MAASSGFKGLGINLMALGVVRNSRRHGELLAEWWRRIGYEPLMRQLFRHADRPKIGAW